ncbi:MAG: hypothetical protein EBQ80_03140 [Proteobacteria bacterium]|nr:hypothetical protein [Pseudomonadota bacterium]
MLTYVNLLKLLMRWLLRNNALYNVARGEQLRFHQNLILGLFWHMRTDVFVVILTQFLGMLSL